MEWIGLILGFQFIIGFIVGFLYMIIENFWIGCTLFLCSLSGFLLLIGGIEFVDDKGKIHTK